MSQPEEKNDVVDVNDQGKLHLKETEISEECSLAIAGKQRVKKSGLQIQPHQMCAVKNRHSTASAVEPPKEITSQVRNI